VTLRERYYLWRYGRAVKRWLRPRPRIKGLRSPEDAPKGERIILPLFYERKDP